MWDLNGITLVVQEYGRSREQLIARLDPLASGTVYHFFGYEKPTIKVSALIAGDVNLGSLEALSMTGDEYNFSYTTTVSGVETTVTTPVYVKNVNSKRVNTIYQTFDTTQDCTASVYMVDMELYKRDD